MVVASLPNNVSICVFLGNAKAAASGLETNTKNKETADMLGKSHSVQICIFISATGNYCGF